MLRFSVERRNEEKYGKKFIIKIMGNTIKRENQLVHTIQHDTMTRNYPSKLVRHELDCVEIAPASMLIL